VIVNAGTVSFAGSAVTGNKLMAKGNGVVIGLSWATIISLIIASVTLAQSEDQLLAAVVGGLLAVPSSIRKKRPKRPLQQ
jgi:hypothetical protein